MKKPRYILEGTWSGYSSSQERVVHRTIVKTTDYPTCIRYTDGTCLYITVREAKPRERVQEIHGYDSLIADCRHYGVSSVQALMEIEQNAKSK